jgi:hypothetical protein
MITGKVFLEKEAISDIAIFESNEAGLPIKRNNTFNAVKTDKNGNYSIDLPQNATTFITYKFVGTNGATLPTNRIPAILNLASNLNLDNVDVIYKKPKYWWLLLLIPLYYLVKKK